MGVLFLPFAIASFVVAIVINFKQSWAPVLTPVYALGEGAVLGAFSMYANRYYPGVVFQAVVLTFGVLFSMLFIYKTRMIQVTDRLRTGVSAAMMGICVFYLITFVLSLFHVNVGIMSGNGPLSIGISLVVVAVAAFSLLLDFDFIEKAAGSGSLPKYMEWFAAFGLLVSLVWLYMELVRLLSKLQASSRD
jgi:uncharacterized YccA/Bax inhibitor family protein